MLLIKENKIFTSVIQFNCLEKITGNSALTICNTGSIDFTRSGEWGEYFDSVGHRLVRLGCIRILLPLCGISHLYFIN